MPQRGKFLNIPAIQWMFSVCVRACVCVRVHVRVCLFVSAFVK